jgi:Zn-dependent metalloprotease
VSTPQGHLDHAVGVDDTKPRRGPRCGRAAACVVPPYILTQIAVNGTKDQRRKAARSLLISDSIRSSRTVAQRQPAALVGATQRRVHDAQSTQQLPGQLVRAENDPPTGDVHVNEAYDGLGATFDLFADIYDRDSIDDAGMNLVATVHFDVDYANAFWDGAQMVFGDGDGELFNRFTIALDVIGHELAHGVTEIESGLVYFGQPGALNEHVSDVFGSLVKQYANQETADRADWLIGEGLLTDAVQGVALRSMKSPGSAYDDPVLGKDPQPGHTRDYVRTLEDNGGVHINSGIPNRAFYLIASTLGGHAWERAGEIWYQTLLDPRLPRRIGFRGFAALTIQNAVRLFGLNSDEHAAVREGWSEVGVTVGAPLAMPRARAGRNTVAAARAVDAPRPWEAGAGGGDRTAAALPDEPKPRRARPSR